MLELYLPACDSLKEKRSIVKSLIAKARQQFNVAIAEVEDQDSLGRAVLGIACISTEKKHAHSQIEKVVHWIEAERPDLPLGGYEVEIL